MSNKEPSVISAERLARTFREACVSKDHHTVRIVTAQSVNGRSIRTSDDYFELDPAGIIVKVPRGHATLKGFRVINLDAMPPMIVFGQVV